MSAIRMLERRASREARKGGPEHQPCSACDGTGRVKGGAGRIECPKCKGSGQRGSVAKSSVSAEADSILFGVTGEGEDLTAGRHPVTGRFLPSVKTAPRHVRAAAKVLKNATANQAEKGIAASVVSDWVEKMGNGGDATTPGVEGPKLNGATSADDIGAIFDGTDDQYIAKMRKALRDPNIAPADAELLGEQLTRTLLAASHSQPAGTVAKTVKLVPADASNDPLERLRELHRASGLDPALKAEVGQLLTRHDLAKAAVEEGLTTASRVNAAISATDQADATVAATRAAQAGSVTGQPSLTGVSSAGQVGSIGSGSGVPLGLGQAQQVGNRGDLTGRQGRIEAEPIAHVLGRAENELAKATGTIERERLGEAVTYLRLRAARGGLGVAA